MLVHAMAAMSRGGSLDPWQYETAEIGPYDCIIKVQACGLCHSDIHVIDGFYNPTYPVVPGHAALYH
jgi:D-arabinose 1-dehydrogenase-like Zn-dependent alcohol dehydrogenase